MCATSSIVDHPKILWRRKAIRTLRVARIVGHILLGALLARGVLPGLRSGCRQIRADALVRWWLLGVMRILNLRVVIEGSLSEEPALLVCNHVSWMDVVCLGAIANIDFVAKDDVLRWPFLGGMIARVGTIFLARGKHDTTALASDRMTWSLRQRRHVLFFPEGTTTDGAHVRPFHRRLFQAAIRARSPVQPIAISYPHGNANHPKVPFIGDDNLVRHLWDLLAEESLTVKVCFCQLLRGPGHDRRSLAEISRGQILTSLGINAGDRHRIIGE